MFSDNNTSPMVSRSIITTLGIIQQRFLNQLPPVFIILGSIGFIGNAFTFLQPTLRSNTFCIYTLCGSLVDVISLFVNLLPSYIYSNSNITFLIYGNVLCKWTLLMLVYLPQLSMNLLILSLIDRFACTCSLGSRMRRIHQLKMVPWLITITFIVTGLMSLYSPLLYDVKPGLGCVSTNPLLNSVLYTGIHGLLTPLVMLLFVWLTFRNVQRSRQRVGVVANIRAQRQSHYFIRMVFIQVIVTSFFVLQWIGMYIYFIATQNNNKSAEQWSIDLFMFLLTNTLYYTINVKSFYLSTLTSDVFRKTFIKGILKLMGRCLQR